MLIKALPLGQLETNCYIVTDEESMLSAVIDPGDESNTIMDYLEDNHMTCKAVLLTHGHFDHTMAVNAIVEETGATVYMSALDTNATVEFAQFRFNPPEGTVWLKEGDEVQVGALTFKVLETPGHTPGGLTFLCGDALFTGDTLFRDACGRVDFPGGDMQTMLASLRKLSALPGDYEVYPGHMDATTLSRERRHNYYIQYALQNG